MNGGVTSVVSVVAFCAASGLGAAQAYPNKSIRLVVPWPPSGTVDILARPLAQKLTESIGQTVVVDNRPGANSIVGSDIVARATPDGYTLLVDNVTGHSSNASLYKKLPFNSLTDFSPIALIASTPNALVVHPSTPVQSVKDVVAAAKSQPGKFAYASFGTGSAAHLAGELFKIVAHIDLVHVPYKGGAPALADLMGGRVYMMFASLPSAIGHIQGNRLRAIVIAGQHRSRVLPDVPTTAETGLRGLDATTWYGAMFPAHTSRAVVARMNQEITNAIRDREMAQRFQSQGYELVGSTPEALAKHLTDETVKWTKVVKQSGAQLD
jgi:tripartite-type tricarboxylate transporter receptor subunit TctC